jgi:hypothetical protein
MKPINLMLLFCFLVNLCVTVTSVDAERIPGGVQVAWQTVNEFDIIGFNVYRAKCESCQRVRVNDSLIPATNPGSLYGDDYSLKVKGHKNAWYWMETISLEGRPTLFAAGKAD